jgi:hypothetical protein
MTTVSTREPQLRKVVALAKEISELLDDGNLAPSIGAIEDPDEAREGIRAILQASSALSDSVYNLFGRIGVSYCYDD